MIAAVLSRDGSYDGYLLLAHVFGQETASGKRLLLPYDP